MAYNVRIKNKRDTAVNWEAKNPIPLEGEIIIVITNAGDTRFKVGDGIKTYTQLPFQDESLYNVLSDKADFIDLESLQTEIDERFDSLKQPDWAENDGTSSAYIKNRPFYSETIRDVEDNMLPATIATSVSENVLTFAVDSGLEFDTHSQYKILIECTQDEYTDVILDKFAGVTNPKLINDSEFDISISDTVMTVTLNPDIYEISDAATYTITIDCGTEHEYVVQIDPKYLPTSLNPDWYENDETSESYISNRTHYVVHNTSEPIYFTDLSFTEAGTNINGETIYVATGTNDGLAALDIYYYKYFIIGYNNTESYGSRADIAENVGLDLTDTYFFGSSAIHPDVTAEWASDTGEPYFILISGNNYSIYTREVITSISIEDESETVYPLDEKFIPDTIARTNDLFYKADAADLEALRVEVDSKQSILTFDSTPTEGSQNPVTSDGIKVALDSKQDILTFDSTPTEGSQNPVTSDGIKVALDSKQDILTFDSTPIDGSENPVTSDGVKTALDDKQDILTFDSVPTDGSENPVTSDGIKTALESKQDILTFDSTPTTGSQNPVTSDGIKNALDLKQDVFANTTITNNGITSVDGIVKITNDDDTAYISASNMGLVVLNDSKVLSITTDNIQFVGADGSFSGLGTPTEDDHAANKGYVDSEIHTGFVTTAGTGAAYTATVPGIDALTAGVSFIMVPHTASTTTAPTLNVNGLGAKSIKRRVSTITSNLVNGYGDSWLNSGKPIHLIYDGTYWVVQGMEQPHPNDLFGAVPVSKGGTGYTSMADTTYTTARYRGSALYAEANIVDPTTNGVINWAYA